MISSHIAIELELKRRKIIGKPLKSQLNYKIVNGTCMTGKQEVI
jgi:hypothetical protein